MAFFYSTLVFIFNRLMRKFHVFNKQALLATFGLLVQEQFFNLTIQGSIPGRV